MTDTSDTPPLSPALYPDKTGEMRLWVDVRDHNGITRRHPIDVNLVGLCHLAEDIAKEIRRRVEHAKSMSDARSAG